MTERIGRDDRGVSFTWLQRALSFGLSILIFGNLLLTDAVVYAAPFEAKLNDIRQTSPQDLSEFGLVNVVVEEELEKDRDIAQKIQNYCKNVQKVTGAVCQITPWKGETPSRIVEALQQMYFEGVEVKAGLAKLVGIVLIGEVPLPVVHQGEISFPSIYPYTDLVHPAYVYDSSQAKFIRSQVQDARQEIFHGIIRPPGKTVSERTGELRKFFLKNEKFYAGDPSMAVFDDAIGFQDQFWENESFDNETKRWYLKKMASLDRIMNYRYSGAWLKELSGEAVSRLKTLTSQKFEDAPVKIDPASKQQAAKEAGFDNAAITSQVSAASSKAKTGNPDIDEYGGGRLSDTVPDPYSPGPIRNMLKDYVSVVQRYVSGVSELLDVMGRRQRVETLPTLITTLDRYSAVVLKTANDAFENYFLNQAKELAMPFELVQSYDKRNEFASPPKLDYEVQKFERVVNGAPISGVNGVSQCSLELGSHLEKSDEDGRVVSLNRKDNPLTSQDIAGVKGRKPKEEIKKIYEKYGYCSYPVRKQCNEKTARLPIFDYGASEIKKVTNDYRTCLNRDGAALPKDPKALFNLVASFGSNAKGATLPDAIERAVFQNIGSLVDHREPSGKTVSEMLKKKLAHYFPFDAIRHASFYLGGGGFSQSLNVGRLLYPDFFDVEAKDSTEQALKDYVEKKERELRKARVEANWKRFSQYLANSTPVPGKADFWNYQEISGFDASFVAYREDVLNVLRKELDPEKSKQDFELAEEYLLGKSVTVEIEKAIQDLLKKHFPTALAKEELNLKCSYSYKLPPLSIKITIPKIDPQAMLALEVPQITLPNVNPPSISRACNNQVAKNTVREVKTLREFYASSKGVTVDMAILHHPDGFIEKMDPKAVALVLLGPVPMAPPVPHPTFLEKGIEMLDAQVKKLEQGPQPVTRLTKIVKPVSLKSRGELQSLSAQFSGRLLTAVQWLNLSIEAKHREALEILAKNKAMTYLVMDGDSKNLNLNLPGLQTSFTKEETQVGGLDNNVIEAVKKKEDELQKKLEEGRERQGGGSQDGEITTSKCGESVPLLKWPKAVQCWLQETLKGPLIETPEEESVISTDLSRVSEVEERRNLEFRIPDVRELRDLSTPPSNGSPRVARDDKDGQDDRSLKSKRATLRARSAVDLQIGTAETVILDVQITDQKGTTLITDETLDVGATEIGVVDFPSQITVVKGKGTISVKPGTRSGIAGIFVQSDTVTRSREVPMNVLSGKPAKLQFDFGDQILGRDQKIDGALFVTDVHGNPVRADAFKVKLSWTSELMVNGRENETSGAFFVAAGKVKLEIKKRDSSAKPNDTGVSIHVDNVEGFPDLQKPEDVKLDLGTDYRVNFIDLPNQVTSGQAIPVTVEVTGASGPIPLQVKTFSLKTEIAGVVSAQVIPMRGVRSSISVPTEKIAGVMKLMIDDPDFGSENAEVAVLGTGVASLSFQKAIFKNGTVEMEVTAADKQGNPVSLQKRLLLVTIIGEGGEQLVMKNFSSETEKFEAAIPVPRNSDRLNLTVALEAGDIRAEKTLVQDYSLSTVDLVAMPWSTPYLVLGGSVFGDYREQRNVASSMLFSSENKIQTITTELTPHRDEEKLLSISPSGRILLHGASTASVLIENGKPVLVFKDRGQEYIRLYLNPSVLDFEVQESPLGIFEWTRKNGIHKAILVPDDAEYMASSKNSGELRSKNGKRLLSFDQGTIQIHDDEIKAEIIPDDAEALVLQFSLRNVPLASWTLNFEGEAISSTEAKSLYVKLFPGAESRVLLKSFFAGESTLDPQGIMVMKKGEQIPTGVGELGKGLDEAKDQNGQGFTREDKTGLLFMAGNTVGSSTMHQSEGIVNYGDPVLSLRQAKKKTEAGGIIPLIDETESGGEEDYSIGQLIYRPEKGEIKDLLRADVENDGEDDLLMLIRDGKRSRIRYLEGEGEGARWGEVSDLLDLGQGVEEVKTIRGNSFIVRYESGQISIQENFGGKFREKVLNLSFLGKTPVRIIEMQIADFDADKIDDLTLMTGNREIWILYGSLASGSFQLGAEKNERQLLGAIPVTFKKPQNLLSGVWILGDKTPSPVFGCTDVKLECQRKYFRAFEGQTEAGVNNDVDYLSELTELSQIKPYLEEDGTKGNSGQRYLVRYDQLRDEQGLVRMSFKNIAEGTAATLKQRIPVEMIVSPKHTEKQFVLRLDLGKDFRIAGTPECSGCGKTLGLSIAAPQSLFSLEGALTPGKTVTLKFTLEMTSLPDFSLSVMKTNDDQYPDLAVNTTANQTGAITVFESREKRKYVETVFGDAGPTQPSGQQKSQATGLFDLMKGIGIQGKSKEELKKMILDEGKKMQTKAGKLFEETLKDENQDGYPDLYQEALPRKKEVKKKVSYQYEVTPERDAPSGLSEASGHGAPQAKRSGASERATLSAPRWGARGKRGALSTVSQRSFLNFLFPRASAQAASRGESLDLDQFTNLDQQSAMLDDVRNDVEQIVKALKCTKGCLPLPINFSFLTPGPINIFGVPAGQDPGLPVFGLSPLPFFIWPPLVDPYSTQFRIYISPTLTLGLGIGICLGPYIGLQSPCYAFTVPIQNFMSSESICDAAKKSLQSIVRGLQEVVGEVKSNVKTAAGAMNRTGVIKASVSNNNNLEEAESYLGIKLGGGSHKQGASPNDPKVFLEPIAKVFVEWWDRQFEEIINSLTDLPDITVRLPTLRKAFGYGDDAYWDKMGKKLRGETFVNLQQLYDILNSLPVLELHPEPIQIQIPWIEPGLLQRIEASLYKFLTEFFIEMIEFLRSFNVPCTISESRDELYAKMASQIRSGKSKALEKELKQKLLNAEASAKTIAEKKQKIQKFIDDHELLPTVGPEWDKYSVELDQKQKEIEDHEKQLEDIAVKIRGLSNPKSIMSIAPVLGEALGPIAESWANQVKGFTDRPKSDVASELGSEAARSCLALKFGADLIVDVKPFVKGIQENLEKIEAWKKFPRELAKYLNIIEFYLTEVSRLIDQVTSVVVKWWKTFEKRLDLWLSVIVSYEELVAMVNALVDILKGYNKKCGLCTSDRLTLKELIMKILFGVVPKFPIINFPDWPDIRIDLSNMKASLDVQVPVFDVRAAEIAWPGLPKIKLPRFKDIQISAFGELKVGASVKLPKIPLVLPDPPTLPPLEPLPDFPKINLPNLPPAPEVPRVMENLLPLMKIIETVLNIWCLINKSLIPLSEGTLKTQIENLTNRSGNLILPIDVLMNLDIAPGELLDELAPFDLIDVKSAIKVSANVNPASEKLQETIDESFHKPINQFVDNLNQWIKDLKNASQKGLDAATKGPLQELLDQAGEIQIQEGISGGFQEELDLKQQFPELENIEPLKSPINQLGPLKKSFVSRDIRSLIAGRQKAVQEKNAALKERVLEYQDSVEMLRQIPEDDLLGKLAKLTPRNLLAVGPAGTLLPPSKPELEERTISLLDKPKLLAQVSKSKSALEKVSEDILGQSPTLTTDLGTSMVRDGEARRIQDYPLQDPAVLVWDNDIFLGYEGAVFVKSIGNGFRKPRGYQGSVLRNALAHFQRSKVHQLEAELVPNAQSSEQNVTFQFTWDSPGVTDVELTLWDTIGGAQRLDQEHKRFFLKQQEALKNEFFESLSRDFVLKQGEDQVATKEISLRFGSDRVIIPSGMTFRIPSLLDRSVKLSGSGTVFLENLSGKPWTLDLQEGVSAKMTGLVDSQFEGPFTVLTPSLEKKPLVKRIKGKATGAFRKRVDVRKGELIPAGDFYALGQSRLTRSSAAAFMDIHPGVLVKNLQGWKLEKGRGHVVVGTPTENQNGTEGMLLLPDELLNGEYLVEEQSREFKVLESQELAFSKISGQRFDVTVPRGNYYARIRDREGKRGFSPIVLAGGDKRNLRFANADVVGGATLESLSFSIFVPFTVDGRQYVIGDLPEESFHWKIEGDDRFLTGSTFVYPGFETVGKRKLQIFIRKGEEEVAVKTFDVNVFLPKLSIDEKLFKNSRVIQVTTEPRVAGLPIGVVGRRDKVEDWFLEDPSRGTRNEDRYLTDSQGVVEFPSLLALEGRNIIIEDGMKVARLYPNGRVVLNPEYEKECQNDPLLDSDGFLKYRVSCLEEGRLVKKFDVRMVPDRDTDSQIVEEFSNFTTGVSVRGLQPSLELKSILSSEKLFPGGVQARGSDGNVLFMISREGQVELLKNDLRVAIKAFQDPLEPVLWQLYQNEIVLLEFNIKGPDRIAIIDPVTREALTGDGDQDGMADRWEVLYGVSEPNEDPDLDGLTNLEEFRLGTDPRNRDTDGDGVPDKEDEGPINPRVRSKKTAFLDVPETRPDAPAIKRLTQLGFIKGYEGNVFKPDQAVTRAEALKMLMSTIKCENCQTPSTETREEFDPSQQSLEEFVKFHDDAAFYNQPRDKARGRQPITNNQKQKSDSFAFTQDELQTLLPSIGSYFDVRIEDWYYYCVEIATKLGLVHGYRGIEDGRSALGKFIPTRSVNIAELAKMVVEAIGQKGKNSDKIYGTKDGWWNDPKNNYLATAEEDLKLFLSEDAYRNPLRSATRAEVAYAAFTVLSLSASSANACAVGEGKIDAGLGTGAGAPVAGGAEAGAGGDDGTRVGPGVGEGPDLSTTSKESLEPRSGGDFFSGIEITQFLTCRCLALVKADLFPGSTFFAVITGRRENERQVYAKSNEVTASP